MLCRIYETLGTRISPWRAKPSCRRRGTLDLHPPFLHPINYIRRIVYPCVEGLPNIIAHRVMFYRNGDMIFAKSFDGWDKSDKSSLMYLSWPLQQAPLPCTWPFSLLRGSSSFHLPWNRVQDDIARILGMDAGRLFKFVHPFNRPNLFYEVRSS